MKNILVLGGGHGLSSVVESIKDIKEYNVLSLVATSDSGGHSGKISEEFNVPALGDIRRNLSSTLENDCLLKQLLDYRFPMLHDIKNVSLGNLILLSLLENNDLETVLNDIHLKYNTSVKILPMYNKPIDLYARYIDDSITKKEHLIPSNKKIKEVFYQEKNQLSSKVKETIENADYIIIGPGSLFTSIGAVLADEEVSFLIEHSNAKIIYICNIMTQPNETDDYNVSDHIQYIEKTIRRKIDYILANKGKLTRKMKDLYKKENSYLVKKSKDERIILENFIDYKKQYIRHDKTKLREVFKKIIQ